MANKIQFKRGQKAQLPTLAVGEPGLTTDTKELFIGHPSGNIGIATANQLVNKVTKGEYVIDVKDHGAVGDGVTDDYQAFMNAIAACGTRGILFISKPDITYLISQKIALSAAIRIVGTHYMVSVSENPSITFGSSVLTGFELLSPDITIENLYLKLNSTSNSVVAGIHLNSASASGNANTQLRDLFVHLSHTSGVGVRGRNTITSEFHNVRTFQGSYGFYFDATGTSLKFNTCWAMSCTVTGYFVDAYEYIDFINCACDSPNNSNYGYHIVNCNGVSFNGCGAEGLQKSMFRFEGVNGVTVSGCRAVGMNQSGNGIASFSEQTNSANVNYIGCMESGQLGLLPNVSATGNLYPIIMNCNFPKIKMDTNIYTDSIFEVRGSLKLGGMAIQISPFAGADSFIKNHNLFMSEQRFGVVKTDGSAVYGYFDVDGTVVVRNFAVLPTADASQRGKLARVEGGTGVSDHIYLCIKNAANAYVWQQII